MNATVADPGQQSARALVTTNFPIIESQDAVIMLVKRMLYTYASTPEMTERCNKAYSELFGGARMHVRLPDENFRAPYLHGPPGQGKTSVCRAAAKIVAEKLGLRFLDNPGEDVIPTEKDFYFISQEMSGENSKIEFGGMPAKKTVTSGEGENKKTVDYMTKLPSERLAKSQFAAASCLLFDDFANAAPPIQNVALSVTLERRFQGINLGNVFVALTGNLGGLDGTYTSANSNALMSRCANFYFEDRFEHFETRMLRKYNDELADGGVLSYLRRNQTHFATLPDKKNSPFPCPRTWEGVFPVVRAVVNEARTSGQSIKGYLPMMEAEIQGIVGLDAGKDFSSYMRSVLSEAQPMAEGLMERGEIDWKKLETKVGEATTPEHISWTFQFGTALADNLAHKLIEHENDYKLARPYVERFASGIFRLPESVIAFAGERLRKRLIHHSKTWYDEATGGVSGALAPWRSIKAAKAIELQRDIAKDKGAHENGINAFADAISATRALNLPSARPAARPKTAKP